MTRSGAKRPLVLFLGLLLAISIGAGFYAGSMALDFYKLHCLERLDLGLPSRPAARVDPVDIVYYGDSRIAGWSRLPAVEGKSTFNAGVGGETTAEVLQRIEVDVLARSPRVVVLQVGVNDLKVIGMFPELEEQIFATCEANIRRIVTRITDSGASVLLTTILPAGNSALRRMLIGAVEVDRAFVAMNERLQSLASDTVTVVDCAGALGPEGRMPGEYSDTFLHLNERGYERMSESVRGPLEALLGR